MKNISTLSVVGLGYVGLPLALLASSKGYRVNGIDVDTIKLNSLKEGVSYIDDITDDDVKNSNATFNDSYESISESDAVIVCVPTPVDRNKNPDLSLVINSVTSIVNSIKPNTLIVIESTINPSVCDDIIIPLIESVSNRKVGKDIFLAHCPERINPGDPVWNVGNINRVIGANSKHELELAQSLYSTLIDADIKPMNSLKEAEAVKIVENSFRDINIAFVNELAMSFHKLGINLENVIDGAATKPFAFMAHRPGAGVGGHCIPVDPYYLIEYARSNGFEHRLLQLSRDINESMPRFTVDLLSEALNEIELPLSGARVAMLGASYKPNVGDDRESPALKIAGILKESNVNLTIFDPHMPKYSSVGSMDKALSKSEVVLIATGHEEFKSLSAKYFKKYGIKILIDGRNIFKNIKETFPGEDIVYKGIGI